MKYLRVLITLFIAFEINSYDRVTGLDFASRSEVLSSNGMAATSHPLATQTALSVLQRGGNAIDAAIAANAVLGLMEPTGCGIGGDLFAIVWSEKENKLFGLNSSGPAPQNISISILEDKNLKQIPPYGPLPITVPGAVAGWVELSNKFGNLPFEDLFTEAIDFAEKGFPVTEVVAYYLELSSQLFKDYKNFSKVWMPNGRTPQKGEIFKNTYLANTYKKIAMSNGKDFYHGEIAKEIVSFINKEGGYFSLNDLKNFRPEWIDPVSTNYRGYDIWELPPNGQGIAALQILNILENYNIKKLGFGSAEYIHLFTEAKKIAYEDRAKFYADHRFSDVPVKQLISKEYARKRSKLININQSSNTINPGILEDGDTIYLTVADKDGNMVSLIQSNYRGMGSGVIPNKLGFMLQDRGEMFSLDRNHRNSLLGGKRPFHTIIPAFVTKDGKPLISFGLMGGAMQPQGHAQIIINLIDFEMNLQEAGDAPRIRHVGSSQPTGEIMNDGGYLSLEKGISEVQIKKLKKLGHKIKYDPGGFGGYQAIMLKEKVYIGASDSRKDGQASGY
ncbi:MAG: gamma-glutamyltransferase [Gammaproteobacteria bacterium]|nr:gamma-glutamyltransferase [Gammaproteobacteria bacterium]|tara:strand:+ start:413 stop:2092 length:1680 start_codon:yes stop_codon:yes gene_type:complete